MKKKLLKPRLLSFAAFCGLVLAFSSCANEDIAQKTPSTGNENDKNLTTFIAGDEAKTRTSMDYTSGDFYWEAGDYIYVKDDDGTWRKSSNAPTSKVASFQFKVPGKFNNSATYKVYYPGRNGSNNQVNIPATQTQTAPNITTHFGVSGDCGTADASGTVGGSVFNFRLDHQAAYLVFQPYTSNTVLNSCYLRKIEVISDNDITHTYTLDPSTGELTGTGTGKNIVLTTGGWSSSSNPNGFPLTNTSASLATNGAYMIIKPGTHSLKIRYWVKDFGTNVEGTITKNIGSFTYAKNTYYDMKANLNIRDYDGDHYYMWDAQKQYWYGHEWNKGGSQATVKDQYGGGEPYYMTEPRWANTLHPCPDAQTTYFKTIPNANELSWYVVYGDPCWDSDELWTSMGRLYKSGVWFKKKSVLQAEGHYNTAYSADGVTNLSTTPGGYLGSNGRFATDISPADANNYFFLPTLGEYIGGWLKRIGEVGYFWSSNSYPASHERSYYLLFHYNRIQLLYEYRYYGLRGQSFSDFGDN
ncbi:hypothetical protein J4861_08685 [Prevotella melaninogenica]|uniref:hypothetical protein n=1 Tax=Prevotella melaninogenica TaxID=28132 RepID=UPI001BA6DE3D|nr:hypothetical protein [Prevotella melaninogenica]QUB62283.1 hypothetical protein J4861_08685 [Prevotella melaninogenica]